MMRNEMTEIAHNNLKKYYLVQYEMLASITHAAGLIVN